MITRLAVTHLAHDAPGADGEAAQFETKGAAERVNAEVDGRLASS